PTIRAISAGNTITKLDHLGNVGTYSSITIGADGLGLISYASAEDGSLKVAHCSDIACTNATITTLDTPAWVSYENIATSITIGKDNLGLISYVERLPTGRHGVLKVAHCSDITCTNATITTLDNTIYSILEDPYPTGVLDSTSIAIGADGLGLISYFYSTSHDGGAAMVAHCSDTACTSASITTVGMFTGRTTSISIGSDDLPLITWGNKWSHCKNVSCTTSKLWGCSDCRGVAFTIGAHGFPLYSRHEFDMWEMVKCNAADCSEGWDGNTMIDDTVVGRSVIGIPVSISIGRYASDFGVLMSYSDASNNLLKVARCSDYYCKDAMITTLDTIAAPGAARIPGALKRPSSTIGIDGLGLISYYDHRYGDLKVAHCSNANCSPFNETQWAAP
ncbi:MAG: hypothetical protein VB824_09635, partial [Dehalococcoidia bacterium]